MEFYTTQITSHLRYAFHETLSRHPTVFAPNQSFMFQIHLQSSQLVHSVRSPVRIKHLSPLHFTINLLSRAMWSTLCTRSSISFETRILVPCVNFDSHRFLFLAVNSSRLLLPFCTIFLHSWSFLLIRFCAERRVIFVSLFNRVQEVWCPLMHCRWRCH